MQLGEPDASGRRRPEPAPGTEFTIPCDRVLLAIGQGPDLRWIGAGNDGRRRPNRQRRLKADAVTFETDRPGVFGAGDVRIGAATVVQAIAEGRRAAYAVDAYLKGNDLAAIRTRQTLAEPQPEFLSIVPFTGEVKEPRYRLKALEPEARNTQLHRVRDPVHPRRGRRRVHPLPPVHLRGDRVLRPAPPGHRVRHDAQDAREGLPPGRRATGRSPRTGSRASTTTTSATTATPSSCASPPAASTAAAAPTSAPRWWAPPATTSCGSASTPW